jgi:hypothetical protein
MKKPIKSSDPLKPGVVAALKSVSGGTKVTNVTQTDEQTFVGHCMRKDQARGHWTSLGDFSVTLNVWDMSVIESHLVAS